MLKNKVFKLTMFIFVALFILATVIVLYALSPLHPQNISNKTVANKGVEYTVRLDGVSEFDEGGFSLSCDGFYFNSKKNYFYTDEQGFARTTYDGKGEACALKKYSSDYISYDDYEFCGESYKTQAELEAFFKLPDRIYNFDINNLSEYVQDVIQYEKKFSGKATIKIYRGRCVITEIYIGDEKVLELK